jgi:hypothetical protein
MSLTTAYLSCTCSPSFDSWVGCALDSVLLVWVSADTQFGVLYLHRVGLVRGPWEMDIRPLSWARLLCPVLAQKTPPSRYLMWACSWTYPALFPCLALGYHVGISYRVGFSLVLHPPGRTQASSSLCPSGAEDQKGQSVATIGFTVSCS